MKNRVLYALFRGGKGRRAFPLLLALLVVILCGCQDKAVNNASPSDRQAPDTVESSGAQSPEEAAEPPGEPVPDAAEPPGEPVPDAAEPPGEPVPEGGEPVAEPSPEGGDYPPEEGEYAGEYPPETGEYPQEDAEPLTIKISGLSATMEEFSGIISTINGKMQTFDEKLTRIANQDRNSVSTPVFLTSLLLVCVLNVALTVIVIFSFSRKFKNLDEKLRQLEKQIGEQRAEAGQQKQELQEAISEADNQETLDALAEAIGQYTKTVAAYVQSTAPVKKTQAVAAAQTQPKQEFYQVFPAHSAGESTTLEKSETRQPVVGWALSKGVLTLEPSVDREGKCSRNTLYSEQMTACFVVQPPDPADSANFYTVEVSKKAQAVYENGRYVLRTKGQLLARR